MINFFHLYFFFLLLLLVCLCANQTCTNNNRSGVTQYIFTGELMCGTTTMNARNILKCVRELSLAFTWHVLVCEWRVCVFAPRIRVWQGFSQCFSLWQGKLSYWERAHILTRVYIYTGKRMKGKFEIPKAFLPYVNHPPLLS